MRAAGRRAPELCALSGSVIPFPKTKAERQTTGDPRLSLEERYGDAAGLVTAVRVWLLARVRATLARPLLARVDFARVAFDRVAFALVAPLAAALRRAAFVPAFLRRGDVLLAVGIWANSPVLPL